MPLTKPTAVLCAGSGVLCAPSSSASTTSPWRPWSRAFDPPLPCYTQQYRSCASVRDDRPSRKGKDHTNHQPSWPTSPNPTPYEILGVARGATYNKTRYFHFAKLYHPDRRQHTAGDGISHVTKLERYRLVVAANEILSNPQKRRMYDLYGIGWDHPSDIGTRHRAADRAWRQQPGNASMNATWEDWEKWYQQRDGPSENQDSLFTSNVAFAAVVAMFLVIGTWGQVTRAGSIKLMDVRDQRHAAISQELRRRRSETAGLNREGRIESFVRQREVEKWAYDPPGHGISFHDDHNGAPNK